MILVFVLHEAEYREAEECENDDETRDLEEVDD